MTVDEGRQLRLRQRADLRRRELAILEEHQGRDAADAELRRDVAVLVDVPCSGTGTLARNPEIKWRLSTEDLGDLQSRQIAILKSALDRLASGGRLVYSTCSLEREENEAVVETALTGASDFSIADCREELEHLQKSGELRVTEFGTLLSGPYLRTIPGVYPCDGFFAAIIERTPTTPS